jgi:Flp pilus assembly protein CpaB
VVCAVAAGAAVRQARGPALLVATAAADLRQGTRLDPSDLAWAEVRVSEEVAATLVSRPRADALAGWVLAGNVAAGQLLAASSLVEPAARSELRAMSVPLPVERAVAGDLRVGDRVDVLAATATASGYIAADVAVLAVGSPTTGGIGAGAWSVTLAVDDVTALAVAQALEGGSVHVTRATGAAPAEVDLRVWGWAPTSRPATATPMARLRPAEVAIASTDASWATALTEWLTDHDDALRLRDHYLTTEADLRGQRYDALVIDAAHSLLTAYTVAWVTGGGRALVVVAEGDEDRVRLGNLGVEHVIDAAADPARMAALIAQVVATRREFAAVLRPSEGRPAARPTGGITTVVTGVGEPAGAVEVAVGVAVELRRRGGAVTLIDADTAYPQLAQRLCLDGAPGLLDAVDAVTHGHARPADALQVVARLGVHALVGLESPRHWQRLGAADTAATVEALRVMAHHLVILAGHPRRRRLPSQRRGPQRRRPRAAGRRRPRHRGRGHEPGGDQGRHRLGRGRPRAVRPAAGHRGRPPQAAPRRRLGVAPRAAAHRALRRRARMARRPAGGRGGVARRGCPGRAVDEVSGRPGGRPPARTRAPARA